MSLGWIAYAFLVVDPISCLMLAWLIVRYEPLVQFGAFLRFSLALFVLTLMWHMAEQVEIITGHRAATFHASEPGHFIIHFVIWKSWFRFVLRRPVVGNG